MLAVTVFVHGGRFHCKPRAKDMSSPMLSAESAHHPQVHLTWPVSYVSSLRLLCTRTEDYANAVDAFVERLRYSLASKSTIEKVIVKAKSLANGVCAAKRQRLNVDNVLWLVLPYHAGYDLRSWRQCLRRLHGDPAVRNLLSVAFRDCSDAPVCRLAWQMGHERALNVIKNYSLKSWRLSG